MATGEQRVQVELLDAAVTRRDVVQIFRAVAMLPEDCTRHEVADMVAQVLSTPNEAPPVGTPR